MSQHRILSLEDGELKTIIRRASTKAKRGTKVSKIPSLVKTTDDVKAPPKFKPPSPLTTSMQQFKPICMGNFIAKEDCDKFSGFLNIDFAKLKGAVSEQVLLDDYYIFLDDYMVYSNLKNSVGENVEENVKELNKECTLIDFSNVNVLFALDAYIDKLTTDENEAGESYLLQLYNKIKKVIYIVYDHDTSKMCLYQSLYKNLNTKLLVNIIPFINFLIKIIEKYNQFKNQIITNLTNAQTELREKIDKLEKLEKKTEKQIKNIKLFKDACNFDIDDAISSKLKLEEDIYSAIEDYLEIENRVKNNFKDYIDNAKKIATKEDYINFELAESNEFKYIVL